MKKLLETRQDLTDAILIEADLSQANLSNTNLTRANLKSANLERSTMNGIKLDYAILCGAIMPDGSEGKCRMR